MDLKICTQMKKKLLVFHKALGPYRIDLFNELNNAFEAHIYLFLRNFRSQIFDMSKIEEQLNFKPKFLTAGFDFQYKGRMIRFGYLRKIIQFKPDLILVWEYNIISFISALFTKTIFPKTKVYSLCDDSVDIARNSSVARRIGRNLCLKLFDGIVLNNEFTEEWFNKKFPKVRTTVFPILQKEERLISIIEDAYQITQEYVDQYKLKEKNILLFVGRLVEVKNLNFLIEVFSQYAPKNKNATLILVGDGDHKSELINLAERLKIQDQVIFVGHFERKELYSWFRVADYFILSSTWEPFGAVVNESLIAGIPVLCSKLAGASCLINNKNGKTFDPYDKEELLAILNDVFSKKRNQADSSLIFNSLMPYTFNQKIHELISFLKNNESE
jgi:glycosyltransferase involved in cell wall biosynthesis